MTKLAIAFPQHYDPHISDISVTPHRSSINVTWTEQPTYNFLGARPVRKTVTLPRIVFESIQGSGT